MSHTHVHELNPEATPFLPSITSLPTLPDAALISTLDLLFEPSPELHALALPTLRTISFSSYPDLISTLRDELLAIANAVAVSAADPSVPQPEKENIKRPLHAILGSHPRLGEPKKETLSAQSKKEQAHLNAAGDSEEVKEQLRGLNKEYEERFPGLRYVVWVNGRPRSEIMADMRRRIERGDLRAEEREGIKVSFFSYFRPFLVDYLPIISSRVAMDGKADSYLPTNRQCVTSRPTERPSSSSLHRRPSNIAALREIEYFESKAYICWNYELHPVVMGSRQGRRSICGPLWR